MIMDMIFWHVYMPQHFFKEVMDCPDVTFAIGTKITISYQYNWGEFHRSHTRNTLIAAHQTHAKDFCKVVESGLQLMWKKYHPEMQNQIPHIRNISLLFD